MTGTARTLADPFRPGSGPLARLGEAVWRLFTSVDFAVAQIILLVLMGTVGMTLQQLPDAAYRGATDHAAAMDRIHARYDTTLGTAIVGVFERIGLFGVFHSWWFSLALIVLLLSIVICTIDRTPRLWRSAADVRVVQPDPFYDPALPDRARIDGLTEAAVAGALRRRGFRVRRETVAGSAGPAGSAGVTYLYGDRHQYTKLATLLTHLGLILFLVAAAVTSRFGFEAGLVVPDGGIATVQAIGTPGLLVAKNNGFEAPRRANGSFADFSTDLSIFSGGEEVARRTIRVNDPLAVAGYTFHQNGFGPAPAIRILGTDGALLWDGPVPLTDAVDGRPYGTMGVPGRDYGIQLLLDREGAEGSGGGSGRATLLVIPYRVTGTATDGTDVVAGGIPVTLAPGGSAIAPGLDIVVAFDRVSAYTLLIAKRDPGQGIVWLAFLALIAGIAITFYLPRRRVWARLAPSGELALVARSDRYVDMAREFGGLLDDLALARSVRT